MPEWFSLVVLVGGLCIFVASLVYAREFIRFRKANRESIELMRRASAAAYLPPEEREREFAEVSRIGWARLGQTSPVYEHYIATSHKAANGPNGGEDLGDLISELAEIQQAAGLDSPAAQEKLALLRQQLDRPAG